MAGIQLKNGVVNQNGAPSINENTLANRPTFGQTGRLFVDTTNNVLQRDTGTSWVQIGAVATTPDLAAVCVVGNSTTGDIYVGSNIRVGRGALSLSGNTVVGSNAMSNITTSAGDNNTAVGNSSLYGISTGSGNTAIGYQSGENISSGSNNTCIGYQAGDFNLTTSSSNTFLGYQAGRFTGGFGNICIGYQNDTQQSIGSFNGTQNTYIGYGIGVSVSSYTSYNVFIGTTTGSGYTGNGINGLNTLIGSLLDVTASPTITGNIIMGNNTGKKIQMYSSNNWVLGGGADNGIHQLQCSGGIYCQTLSPSGVTFAGNLSPTLGSTNYYYVYTGAGFNTFTFPTALANNNIYLIKNMSTNSITLACQVGQNLVDLYSTTLNPTLTLFGGNTKTFIADGNNKFYQTA
jgi:hypothetical protein